MKINKKNIFFLSLVPLFSFFAKSASAVCPVCIVAVSTCVGFSRYFGVDDTISGVWIGGLLIALVFWTIDWLEKKNIKFIFRKILILLFWYGLSIGPLYYIEFIGHPANQLWGMDKLILGIIWGTAFFLISLRVDKKLREKNEGKVFFPFQKVVVPISALAILSVIFYFLTC